MVKIAARDFNKDMGAYLEKRTAKSYGFKRSFSFKLPFRTMKKIDEEVPDIEPTEVHVEYKQPTFFSKLFSLRRGLIKKAAKVEDLTPEEMSKLKAMEKDIEKTEEEIVEKEEDIKELKEEEEELIEKRENLLSKLFSKINFFKRKPAETIEIPAGEEEAPIIDGDLIDVIKISHKWLEQLTPGKRRSFKASNDFQKYKDVLNKYGLIRK